ncbi:acyl-CoA-binding domain-containing protein 5A-like isoform X2 [Genypterus blacodes]|uniref:acyl-CoA-binding domain-containing protein 5A-like isoform X2 n=1 Tax=Genypterus blacodes TaxID=154954 RepID=UPI003F7700BC
MAQEDEHSLKDKFTAAVRVIRSLPEEGPFQPSDVMMQMFYSYYTQATLGPCNIPRPTGFWDTHGKAEWDAWSSLGDMTKEEAMMNYVEDIQLILETIPVSDEVSDLVQKLGSFYTLIEGDEDEDIEADKRPFTRPFANNADLSKPFQKPLMEGYGDLWADIQNLGETGKECIVHDSSEGSKENMERKGESSDLKRTEEEVTGDEDDDTTDEEEDEQEEEKGWSPDPRLLRVEDSRGRSGTRGSNSSMEPSMSSITNGTHSSLNSDMEEEELVCSTEATAHHNPYYMHFNGLSDHSDAVSEKNYRTTDSDNEEFCDSMEHLAMEEALSAPKVQSSGTRALSQRPNDLWFESSTTLNGREDQILECSPLENRTHHNSSMSKRGRGSQLCVDTEAVHGYVSPSGHFISAARGNVNEQVAAVLLKLQDDMANVLHRLHALEVITVSQSRSHSPKQHDSLPLARMFLRPSWWPFHFSPLTVAFAALWPLIAHWLIRLYLKWKRRKIS